MKTLTTLFKNNIREYGMLIALLAVMVFFQVQTDGVLFKPVNITNLVLQNSYVITMALGMLLIIVSGWIDLSVGSVVAVIGALAGVLMVRYDVNWIVVVGSPDDPGDSNLFPRGHGTPRPKAPENRQWFSAGWSCHNRSGLADSRCLHFPG